MLISEIKGDLINTSNESESTQDLDYGLVFIRDASAKYWETKRRENKSIIIIQKNVRQFLSKKKLLKTIYDMYMKKVIPMVINIQKAWRRYNALKAAKLFAFRKKFQIEFNLKIRKLSSFYRGFFSI